MASSSKKPGFELFLHEDVISIDEPIIHVGIDISNREATETEIPQLDFIHSSRGPLGLSIPFELHPGTGSGMATYQVIDPSPADTYTPHVTYKGTAKGDPISFAPGEASQVTWSVYLNDKKLDLSSSHNIPSDSSITVRVEALICDRFGFPISETLVNSAFEGSRTIEYEVENEFDTGMGDTTDGVFTIHFTADQLGEDSVLLIRAQNYETSLNLFGESQDLSFTIEPSNLNYQTELKSVITAKSKTPGMKVFAFDSFGLLSGESKKTTAKGATFPLNLSATDHPTLLGKNFITVISKKLDPVSTKVMHVSKVPLEATSTHSLHLSSPVLSPDGLDEPQPVSLPEGELTLPRTSQTTLTIDAPANQKLRIRIIRDSANEWLLINNSPALDVIDIQPGQPLTLTCKPGFNDAGLIHRVTFLLEYFDGSDWKISPGKHGIAHLYLTKLETARRLASTGRVIRSFYWTIPDDSDLSDDFELLLGFMGKTNQPVSLRNLAARFQSLLIFPSERNKLPMCLAAMELIAGEFEPAAAMAEGLRQVLGMAEAAGLLGAMQETFVGSVEEMYQKYIET